MRVIVTRPAEDAADLAATLSGMGHETILAPLLDIRLAPDADLPALPWQAVLITSANGARALARGPAAPRFAETLAVAVGEASAEAARRAGFGRVEVADGDVAGLVRWVRLHLDPAGGPLLYAAGAVTAGALERAVAGAGFSVRRHVLYEAVQAGRLPEACAAAIRSGRADAVLLYSPRTARVWADLVHRHGLVEPARRLLHCCLSANVTAAIRETLGDATRMQVAERPDEPSLLRLLGLGGA